MRVFILGSLLLATSAVLGCSTDTSGGGNNPAFGGNPAAGGGTAGSATMAGVATPPFDAMMRRSALKPEASISDSSRVT